MNKLAQVIDRLNERVGYLVSWLTTAMVLLVCYDVFTRYVLKTSTVAVQELEWHLFAIIFLLGAGYTLKHDRHVRVDVIYLKLSRRVRAWINFGGCLIFLIPFCALVLYSSQTFVATAFRIGETSANPGGLPARFIIKACIPIGFALLLLQAVSLAIKSLQTALGKNESQQESA